MNFKHPTEGQIRRRAYEICLERGGQTGHEIDDWLQAEYELIQLPFRKTAELKQHSRMRRLQMSRRNW